jgi:hypothetical protein
MAVQGRLQRRGLRDALLAGPWRPAWGAQVVSEGSWIIVGRKEEIPPCDTTSSARSLSSSDRATKAVSNAGRCQTVLPLMRTRLDIRPALTGGDTDFGSRAHAGNLPPWGKARGKIPCTPHYCLTDKPHRTCAPAYGLGFSAFLVRFSTLRPDDHCAESASPGGSRTPSPFPSSWFLLDARSAPSLLQASFVLLRHRLWTLGSRHLCSSHLWHS